MTKHLGLLNAILTTPWAILPVKLAAILGVVERHIAGEKLSAEEISAVTNATMARLAQGAHNVNAGNIAVLPLFGTIIPRSNLMTETSGGTSAERWGAMFAQAVADPNVAAIVIDTDSPGGAVSGIDELATQIFKARGTKPIVAVANHLAASAAYWIATAADELVVTPSGEVGSIGVLAAHQDLSKALEAEGVKTTLFSAGKYKSENNPFEPLTDEARAANQARVEHSYDVFVKAVARNRGVNVADVRNGFGEGRVVDAKEAVKLGMADRVETIGETIARLQRGQKTNRSPQAELDYRQRRARAYQI